MQSIVLVNVLDIYLDDDNPRHEPIRDQKEIIKYLVSNEMVKRLAKDIAENGLSPIEFPAVVQDTYGKYTVLEGNRRLCALKLLHDPCKAPKEIRKYFQNLAKSAKKIEKKVRCVEFSNEEEANIWIDRRHNGQQGGIGVKDWDAEQKIRRNSKAKKNDQYALAQELIDYAREKGFLNRFDKRIVTTAARYLGNPYFRKTAGITTQRSNPNVMIEVNKENFETFLQAFCQDLVEGKRVNSRSNKKDWEDYAKILLEEGKITSHRVSEHGLRDQLSNKNLKHSDEISKDELYKEKLDNSSPDNKIDENKHKTFASHNNTGTKNPDTRKYIIPQTFRPTIEENILRRSLQELKKIEVDSFPLAVSLVVRLFLEKTYHLFYLTIKSEAYNKKIHMLIAEVCDIIRDDKNLTKGEKSSLEALKRLGSNENSALSPKTLGGNAHAAYYPDSIQLKREFDNISTILQYMLEKIK